ncbi:centrosomal protein of 131 kDa isoform X3 [Phyllopteryx taeniolatus]|uniref:centrosomal protein of 131 kDa isoform X3 n=1 Tax=Phyllopteryx taeniolatus TaxID=161469 RepID=UPI002AD42858|nr:centrosomal protein of 131 kDa isoform X3 [Phyllopteryx taeniolatus]
MRSARSPPSISATPPGDAPDLSLSGSRLSFVSERPGGCGDSPGKFLARSVSVSAPCELRGKRNTSSDASGSSRSVKNLRRSNSAAHVDRQADVALSPDQSGDYLTALDSGVDGPKKPDGTTWNILDERPRAPAALYGARRGAGPDPPAGSKGRDSAASFTANNRSNKGAVGNAVTAILHNNHGEKPLTPKSSNQRPPFKYVLPPPDGHAFRLLRRVPRDSRCVSFSNILKANDDVSLESASLTKSQKNFSSASSNDKSPAGRGRPLPRRREQVSEQEAERFIQQVNRAAVTIQRWYRRHAGRRSANRAALRHILDSKRKEWRERAEDESRPEPPRDDRKLIREEKAHRARLAAIQELQQKRAHHHQGAEAEHRRPGKKSPKIFSSNTVPTSPGGNVTTAIMSPTHAKANNTADLSEVSFRAASPTSSNNRASPCAQERDAVAVEENVGSVQHRDNDGKWTRQARPRLSRLTIPEPDTCDVVTSMLIGPMAPPVGGVLSDPQRVAPPEPETPRPTSSGKFPPSPPSPRNISPVSAADVKAKNTESGLNFAPDVCELSCFRAVSPSLSSCRGSQCSQELRRRYLSGGDDRSCVASKSTLNDLLDTLKLLEEEPQRLTEPKCYNKDKYAWLDEDVDADSLTADNLERHVRLSLPAPADGAALLSEAKLQSIINFLDEMEKSEQERPRSATSHREAPFLEEEAAPVADQASATAAQVSGSIMRIKMELEEKKRVVEMLQNALAQQRELTVQHVKETEKELSRNLQLQRDQYEATVQRHLAFIDQLIGDKKALSERCEGVIAELKLVDHKYTKKISQMQEQHEMEIKKLKELMSVTEKIRREKWIDEKTKKIKEITVKGLEPEIQKLISKHKQELKKLRALHEAELLQAEERGAERCARQCEELRQQLESEKEERCREERESARRGFEKRLRDEEMSLQRHRRRVHKEVADEKERLAQMAVRQRAEMEELRRRMEENSSVAGRVFREELDKTREEQERRHQAEIKKLQEHFEQEKMNWEEEYRKKQEVGLLRHERQLREELRQERDKEIQLAIWTLEEESNKDKEECERAAQNRSVLLIVFRPAEKTLKALTALHRVCRTFVRHLASVAAGRLNRVRETYEAELKELERSLREALDKQQELRKQHTDTLQQLDAVKDVLRQKEQDVQMVTQNRDRLLEERHGLASVIRQEFSARLLLAEEDAQRTRLEADEVRAALRAEVDRMTKEKEDELQQVHQRVKSAILKKDEAVDALRRQHEAALKRAEHLEALWEEQRRQLLEK